MVSAAETFLKATLLNCAALGHLGLLHVVSCDSHLWLLWHNMRIFTLWLFYLHLVLRLITDWLRAQCHVFDLHAHILWIMLVNMLLSQWFVYHRAFFVELAVRNILSIVVEGRQNGVMTQVWDVVGVVDRTCGAGDGSTLETEGPPNSRQIALLHCTLHVDLLFTVEHLLANDLLMIELL